mmetsp:Transcript_10792/g.35943  ORF Transcript_10792/g.35943 Transcript_10792/m.35943 type:complete len:280 (-) Transcript_10792:116-955(-)
MPRDDELRRPRLVYHRKDGFRGVVQNGKRGGEDARVIFQAVVRIGDACKIRNRVAGIRCAAHGEDDGVARLRVRHEVARRLDRAHGGASMKVYEFGLGPASLAERQSVKLARLFHRRGHDAAEEAEGFEVREAVRCRRKPPTPSRKHCVKRHHRRRVNRRAVARRRQRRDVERLSGLLLSCAQDEEIEELRAAPPRVALQMRQRGLDLLRRLHRVRTDEAADHGCCVVWRSLRTDAKVRRTPHRHRQADAPVAHHALRRKGQEIWAAAGSGPETDARLL